MIDQPAVDNLDEQRTLEHRRRQLLKRLIMVQEEERREVARELHEGAGQMLTSILFGLKLMENSTDLEEVRRYLPQLKDQAWDALETMRQLSVNMWPPLLDDLGLVTTLRSYVRDFTSRFKLEVSFSTSGPELRLDPMVEVTIFRIVQEALVNAGKYSRATQVTVELAYSLEALAVTVEDNGIGMDTSLMGQDHGRDPVGIIGMQERAHFAHGSCIIESALGKGVSVRLTVPIPEAMPS